MFQKHILIKPKWEPPAVDRGGGGARPLSTDHTSEMAKQFNSFNDFWILALYCNYSYGFKNVRSVIEMSFKLLFSVAKSQKSEVAGGSALRPSLWYGWFASVNSARGLNRATFVQKKFSFGSAPSLLALLRFWSHSLLQTDFSSDYMGHVQNELTNVAGLIHCTSIFWNKKTKLLE